MPAVWSFRGLDASSLSARLRITPITDEIFFPQVFRHILPDFFSSVSFRTFRTVELGWVLCSGARARGDYRTWCSPLAPHDMLHIEKLGQKERSNSLSLSCHTPQYPTCWARIRNSESNSLGKYLTFVFLSQYLLTSSTMGRLCIFY